MIVQLKQIRAKQIQVLLRQQMLVIKTEHMRNGVAQPTYMLQSCPMLLWLL